MIPVHFQGKPFKITLIQAYIPTINAKEAEIKQFYEELQELLEVTHTHTHTQKKKSFSSWEIGMQKMEAKKYLE